MKRGSLLLMACLLWALPALAKELKGFPGRDPMTICDPFYQAPREMQIIDDRPVIRDFREAPVMPEQVQLPPAPAGYIYPSQSPIIYDALPPRDPRCYPYDQTPLLNWTGTPIDLNGLNFLTPHASVLRRDHSGHNMFNTSTLEQEAAKFRELSHPNRRPNKGLLPEITEPRF
jgi:hypothetical protein